MKKDKKRKKHNQHRFLILMATAWLFVCIPALAGEKDVRLTDVIFDYEPPACGHDVRDGVVDGGEETYEPRLSMDVYAGEENFYGGIEIKKHIVITTCGGIEDYETFEGTTKGENTYMAYFVLEPEEGYLFDPSMKIEGGEGTALNVLSQTEEELILTAEAQAKHEEDWDDMEVSEATCMSPRVERYHCQSCKKEVVVTGSINENAHQWSEWTIQKEPTVLEEGKRTHTCRLCKTERTGTLSKLYAKAYEPKTSWKMAATVAWRADSSVVTTASEQVRPQVAFVWLDSDLQVYDRDGKRIESDLKKYVEETAPTIIPAFYIRDQETAEALKDWLSTDGLEDCFVVSTPEKKALVKEVADLLHVRGMLDFTSVKAPDLAELTKMTSFVNGSHGKVVLISQEAATYENIRHLQSLGTVVWSQAAADAKTLTTLYTNGVNGVVVDDYQTAYRWEEFFGGDVPALLRVPFIIGHRGDPSNYVENTLDSAKGAYEEGADGIEHDIHLSKDGELVISHDGGISTFTGVDQRISDLTLEEIRSYPFDWDDPIYGIPSRNEVGQSDSTYGRLFGGKLYGQEEKKQYTLPTLSEYIEEFKDKDVVHISEIKDSDPKILSAYKKLVDQYDDWHQFSNITFEIPILEEIYKNYPEIPIGSMSCYYDDPDGEDSDYERMEQTQGPEYALEKLYSVIDQWNSTYNPPCLMMGKEMIRAGRHRGLTAWTWTYHVSTSDSAQIFSDNYIFGIPGLTINQPWVASDDLTRISSKDVTVKSEQDIEKPVGTTRDRETKKLNNAKLLTIEDQNADGTKKLMIWRVRARISVNGSDYGEYDLYSNPFTVTFIKENEGGTPVLKQNAISTSFKTIKATQGKKKKITLSVKAKGGKLSFASDVKKIKVSAKGIVTIPKNYTGRAVITVKASGNGYQEAIKRIVIKVKPKKTMMTKVKAGKKYISLTWKKIPGVSGYEISYSANKSFKKSVRKKNTLKTSLRIRRQKSYQSCYFRARSYIYIRENGKKKKLYSAWSQKAHC